MKVLKQYSLIALFVALSHPQTDQDVGSRVIMRFTEHPRIICVGAEADDCKLSGYIHTYINGRTGVTIILYGQKYKYSLYNQNSIVFTIKIHVTETWYSWSTEPLLNGHLLGLLQNRARASADPQVDPWLQFR